MALVEVGGQPFNYLETMMAMDLNYKYDTIFGSLFTFTMSKFNTSFFASYASFYSIPTIAPNFCDDFSC
jgi:hypothetical protein